MESSDPLPPLIQRHLQLAAALEDRLSALNMHHALAHPHDHPRPSSLIGQYGETVSRIAHSRCDGLLQRQVEADLEGEWRLQMARWEEKIRRLRELLSSKDEEINWKQTTHRQRKRFGLYRNAVAGFEQEEAVVAELILELKTKNKLEREVQQLETATATPHPPSFSMPPPAEVDTKLLRQIAREAERQGQLEQQLSSLLQQLETLNHSHSQLASRYRTLSPPPPSPPEPSSQTSWKTICSTSDDESLEAQ